VPLSVFPLSVRPVSAVSDASDGGTVPTMLLLPSARATTSAPLHATPSKVQ
jgi:hypothetical protein